MNIEIANRLAELRKKSGLSQEELAEKLGLSRQAVSKWERAEASPDMDNIICLSKIYGVSLDDLLMTDKDVETIVDEKPEEEKEEEKKEESSKSDSTNNTSNDEDRTTRRGIHISGKDGSKVDIDIGGVHIVEGNHTHDHAHNHNVNFNGVNIAEHFSKHKKFEIVKGIITGVYTLLALITYIMLGCFVARGWELGWMLFFFTILIPSMMDAIHYKRFSRFAYPVLVVAVYVFVGMFIGMWHPTWVIFISIPIYYMIFGPVDKYLVAKELLHKNSDKVVDLNVDINTNDVIDQDDEDDDEDDDE